MTKSVDKPHVKSLSIRKKLFLLRIGVGLSIGFVIGALSFGIGASIIQKQARSDLVSNARLISNYIQAAVGFMSQELPDMAESEEVEKYYRSSRKALLTALFRRYNEPFGKISYINTHGIIAASLVEDMVLDEEKPIDKTSEYLLALKTPDTIIVGGPEFDQDLQKPVIRFYYQHIDFFDNHLGTLQASVSLDTLARHLDGLVQEKERLFVLITDVNGRIIYGPDSEDFGKPGMGILSDAMLGSDGLLDASYMGQQMVDGSSFLVAAHPLEDPKWNVFILQSTATINQPLFSLSIWIFVVTVVVLILGEILSRLLGVRLIEPIARLRQVTSDIIRDGDLEKRVEWESGDEMGELAVSFNSMLEKIKETQNQLQAERQFNENIIDAMTDLLIVVSHAWDIKKINPNVCRLFGYHEDELVEQPFDKLLPEGRALLSVAEEEKVSQKEIVVIPEKKLMPKAEAPIPISLRVSAIMDHRKRLIGYLITGKDIREELRFRKEQQLAAEKLKAVQDDLLKTEKLAIVGQMSGMVAHEVLNPVSAIYARLDLNIKEEKDMDKVHGLLHQVVSDWRQKSDAGEFDDYFYQNGQKDLQLLEKIADVMSNKYRERVENLNFIYKLICRVIRIIDNLREMSRRKKTLEKIDLIALIDETVEDMGDGLRKRHIEVEKNYAAHPEFSADYMEVYSIFSNLLKNAVQAIEANHETGEKKISIALWQDESMITIQMTDTGIGIDTESETKLFKTGFSNKGREGTGLGLSYSRKIARQLGGDLFLVQSMPGSGSTFQLNFISQRRGHEKRVA
jgi:two-component system, NtrC family, sensor histidine kinase HupT/HoxJ